MTTVLEESLILEDVSVPGYHRVIRARDKRRGLDAIIAIHDLSLSRSALGGIRIHKYPTFEAALTDATRLAQGMTYKSAAAGAGWGGGKSVINADPHRDKNEQLLTAFAEAVDRLQGM